MANPTSSMKPGQSPQATPASSKHLSVRPENAGPAEVRFLFEQQEKRIGGALGISVATHVGVFLLIIVIGWLMPERVIEAVLPESNQDIVFLIEEGPGGGGGGGNENPEPPPPAEDVGEEPITVPAEEPEPVPIPEPEPVVPTEPPPLRLDIPARQMAAAAAIAPGAIASSGTSQSLGPGTGEGVGPGTGDGLGPGDGGGTGGGVRQVGSGIDPPTKIREVTPAYTAEAMRAKVQGIVEVQCVVGLDGRCRDIEVVRSLDTAFGLDQEAIKAVSQWLFAPGKIKATGEPVAVLVRIELSFTLR